jgi:serine/threonine-protein kinase
MIGQTLRHYRITEKIGAGGMGIVYRATDTKLNRDVAIKVLPAAFAEAPHRRARFEREAQLLAALNHPKAAIYGLERENGVDYLVLEYVPGESLAEKLARGPLPIEEAIELAIQIADALDAAHERGVIHSSEGPEGAPPRYRRRSG